MRGNLGVTRVFNRFSLGVLVLLANRVDCIALVFFFSIIGDETELRFLGIKLVFYGNNYSSGGQGGVGGVFFSLPLEE